VIINHSSAEEVRRMNKKENFFMVMNGGEPEYVPNFMAEVSVGGGMFEMFENGPIGGGLDGFGVLWRPSVSAGGQAVPHTEKPLLTDIARWREVIHFPDLEQVDWAALAAMQLGQVKREDTPVEYQSWNAQFLRLTHLMGFENALCALYEEPEECYALMDAITNYKIDIVKKAAQYFKPDFFTSFDDVATERGLFMSPSIYRALIKPLHKKLNDAVRDHGMLPIIHTCGKCEDIVGDFIEEGAAAWSSAQPMNDIVGMQKKYGRRIAIIGGFDMNGRPGQADATETEIRADVRRCLDAYAPGKNYVFLGFRIINSLDPMAFFGALAPINDEWANYSGRYYRHP
jgi:uroporphyrinogen-III decarboxylase